VRRELERQKRLIIDATCPFVRRVQELVSRLREERCRVVIVGKPDHPEVEALKGFAGKDAIVYPVGKNRGGARAGIRVRDGACPVLAVVSQTTNTETLYLEACREILARARAYELRFFDTVCRVTEHRQSAALKLARRVDVMIVAGSPGSANTRNLHHLLLSRKPETFLVAGAEDIKDDWCVPGLVVGLVSGTSTPAETINLIKKKLKGCDPDAGKLRGNF
jgi:4-hydroxy-3-methylbut-2-enyl diphosphate reductase